ncbi:MAG: large conductance mechanosensitive channel protein MscL [Cyanosarcina radialis HA8281-LM2]|jgi:large conductance mechanosensitive channel|nr:large conductance mechanosensitive channel protein MscL [Cyanosarcina radialis HA8281-LM2]
MARSGASQAGGFMRDFRDFIMKGNVVDLAVAVIIGAAFGKIVESLIADIITPAILNPAMKAAGVDQIANLSYNGIKYGLFLAAVLNFIVIAFVIFLLIRAIEQAKKKLARQEAMAEAEAPPDVQERLVNTLDRLTAVLERR